MGQLLSQNTISWNETKKIAEKLRNAGINQFIENYKLYHGKKNCDFVWGYEIEYLLLKKDDQEKKFSELKISDELLKILKTTSSNWNAEYSSFMIESVPSEPFDSTSNGSKVQQSMDENRKFLSYLLKNEFDKDGCVFSLGNFPMFGASDIRLDDSYETAKVLCEYSQSKFVSDEVISSLYPRFKTLTKNIVERRGNIPVNAIIPAYRDRFTKVENIHMDAMAFGMGCCCLQVTMQLADVEECAYIYDQLLAFAPLALSLTASCPIFAGILAERDCRWDLISQVTDDRTKEEIDSGCLPRYYAASFYLHPDNSSLNNVNQNINQVAYRRFLEAGIPDEISKNFAYVFSKDPLVAYENVDYDSPESNDGTSLIFFDNLQTSNWNTVRFKPPTPESKGNVGWRVEFRSMEIQMDDFENAAFTILVVGLVKALVKQRHMSEDVKVSMAIDIDKTHENMKEAQKVKSYLETKFWHRMNQTEEVKLLTIKEIFLNPSKGIIPFIETSIPEFFAANKKYFDFIIDRVTGKETTIATKIRDFVTTHEMYKNDSIVSSSIVYDLLEHLKCSRN